MSEFLRFQWSHQLLLHRGAVRLYNALMRFVPFRIKYSVGIHLRQGRPPYSLVKDCSVVVQIGAPSDTLLAGRSRGMYFCLLAPPDCRVVIIEPDPSSVGLFNSVVHERGMRNITICPMGAWSEQKILKLYINSRHPASNFMDGTVHYNAARLREYEKVEVPVDTVDRILTSYGIEKVDLISINTNGAEMEILKGMNEMISSGTTYIALARTGEGYIQRMEELGYQLFAHDDRGFTFRRQRI